MIYTNEWPIFFRMRLEFVCQSTNFTYDVILSTSIYDLVLLDVCHFHHHHHHVTHTFLSNHWDSSVFSRLSRYSCLHLGSLHPRILPLKSFIFLEKLSCFYNSVSLCYHYFFTRCNTLCLLPMIMFWSSNRISDDIF